MPANLYDALGNEYLKKIIVDTIEASKALNVDFFGVGALAKNIWYAENGLPPRGTKDVDFGVYIPTEEVYASLKSKLIQDFGYVQSENNAFRLISPNGIPVDFLPFGEIGKHGKTLIESRGLTAIKLDGFKEVYEKGIKSVSLGEETINVCTVPSVVLLKLIAYDDRPEHRAKDPMDISSIVAEFPSIETDLLWEEYNYLYDQELSHQEIGMIVLGCEVAKLIGDNRALMNRVLTILQEGIDLESNLAARMVMNPVEETVEYYQYLLSLLKRGVERIDHP